jgi:CRP-like cAMP-binding protein
MANKRLTPDEVEVRTHIFTDFNVHEFAAVRRRWQWVRLTKGELIMQEQESVDWLYMIYRGKCSVVYGEEAIASIGPGQFLGEMAFFTGEEVLLLAENI